MAIFGSGNLPTVPQDMMPGNSTVNETNNQMIDLWRESNEFNSTEAQKAWDRQMEYEANKYKIAKESAQRAGVNPIVAWGNLGSQSAPQANSAGYPTLSNNQTTSSAMLRGASQIIAALIRIAIAAG